MLGGQKQAGQRADVPCERTLDVKKEASSSEGGGKAGGRQPRLDLHAWETRYPTGD